MSELKFGGSVSRRAMEAAIEEMEKRVQGRLSDEDFERVFGPRWAKLKAVGVINNALIGAYLQKASADEDGRGFFDEKEQARLTLERFDARQAPAPVKRRRKGAKSDDTSSEKVGAKGNGEAPQQPPAEEAGNGSVKTGSGQDQVPEDEPLPDDPVDNGRTW